MEALLLGLAAWHNWFTQQSALRPHEMTSEGAEVPFDHTGGENDHIII